MCLEYVFRIELNFIKAITENVHRIKRINEDGKCDARVVVMSVDSSNAIDGCEIVGDGDDDEILVMLAESSGDTCDGDGEHGMVVVLMIKMMRVMI